MTASVDFSTAYDLKHLTHLYLSHNKINAVPARAFQALSHLDLLDLSYNTMEHISPHGTALIRSL